MALLYSVHPNQITQSKTKLLEDTAGGVRLRTNSEIALVVDLKSLYEKIGELALEKDFMSGALAKAMLLSANR